MAIDEKTLVQQPGDGATPASGYRVIGTRPIRHDGVDKVTGRAKYGADIILAGMLHGKVLRSPHAHARIRSIDPSETLRLPGVYAVVTARDLPEISDVRADLGEGSASTRELQENVLASEKVLYRGHAVAAVAASSPHIAEEAVKLIKVEYEVLPHVLDVREAMKPEAPILHPDLRTKSLAGEGKEPTNVAQHLQFELGDVEAGFAQADIVVEREFTTKMVHQGYIEPHNGTAIWNPDGQLTVWTSTQGAFMVRAQLAAVLQHPISKIKVVPMEIGGGFGGKIPIYLEPLAALLSRKTGRPVKMTMSRAEVFEGTGPTSGTYIRMKMGATRDGRLVAAQAWMAYEAGAFPGSAIGAACATVFAPYDLPNLRIDGFDVCVNKPKTFAYRAPGAPAAAFAAEQVVDEIAKKLGMDPIDFRLKNASKEGTRQASGQPFGVIGNIEVLQAAKNSPHYQSPLPPGPHRGRGVASGYWMNAGLKSTVVASVNPDGTVSLIEGSTELGGTRTSIAMQFAETLGIPVEDVKPAVVDTDSVGYTDVTGGSRTTFATGWAAYEAARDVARQLAQRAAELWEVDPATVVWDRGVARSTTDPSKQISFKDLAAKLGEMAPVVGRGTVNSQGPGGAFSTQIVDLEVDPETGKVTILRYTVVQDAGRAIHPAYVEGQMQGGVAQGIGWALNEEYFYNEAGQMLNASLLDYRMPTALDLPMIETIIVEVPNPNHPYGVRGVGEVPIVPPLAAIANAIYHAIGVRMTSLPMSPRAILEAQGLA